MANANVHTRTTNFGLQWHMFGTGDSVQLKIFIPVTSQGQTGNKRREWEEVS